MKSIRKSLSLSYRIEQMYELVSDVRAYPDFLPWCTRAQIVEGDQPNQAVITLFGDFRGLKFSFTTHNTHAKPESIRFDLVDGPFDQLHGQWTFAALPKNRCQIEFSMHYQFSSQLLSAILAPVFDVISFTLIDSFKRQAKKRYG
ncbi:MAG: type II toxin-antitoxin system RatA family toxin [Burkholderiaceae bacterium]|jgi:ribosome-associated toxin RatA of RatAB toxin-antitoxin module|nr:type II toxin-antitoxin system RatA family toxin [Burkholderiaceae bacterium]